MSEKRRDHRGRILHNGEIQLSDGRYRFKYVDEMGKERCVYSWRLDHNDATPKGKRRTLSLREMEKKIQADHFEQIATNGGNMTVLELVEKYTSTKTGVRPTTVAGYGTVINLLKKDPFGKRRIDTVRISDAKCWLIHLQQVEKKSYSSIHSIRGVLRPAFQLSVDDDLIRKNPFQFQLMEVVVNDSVTREAISRAEERKFLQFVKDDAHFSKYYEGIYILFKTGLRISEFCGLTISDIDFKEHTINIDHQLQKKSKIGYYIQETKTTSGTRKMPMTADVEECFRKIIEKRNPPKAEPMVDGKSGFLHFDKNESIKFKLYKKGKKWSIKSHMTDKAINSQRVKLKNAMAQACKSHESEQSQHDDLIRYNQAVIGMHQYYNMATMINADVHRLFPSIDITMKTRLNSRADLSKEKPPTLKGAMDEYFYQKYGESKQVRYINGMIVVPVAYCRTQNPMFYRVDTNRYTPQGRERIHRMLAKSEYGETLLKLSRDNDTNHSIEFCDNRLSRFVASKGKCELSKVSLAFEDVECIYLNPPSQGGTDEYANLRIVHKDIKSLIYSNDVKIIKSLIDLFDCRAPAKIAKLNKWRAKAGLEAINLITINQTLK